MRRRSAAELDTAGTAPPGNAAGRGDAAPERVLGAPVAPANVHRLSFRAPFDWPRTLAFLAHRCIAGVEAVAGDSYVRSASWTDDGEQSCGWLRVWPSPAGRQLLVEFDAALDAASTPILHHLRAVFDLDLDMTQPLSVLPVGTPMRGPMRIVGSFDGFELALRAIIGQQISVKAARTVIARIVEKLGVPLVDAPAGISRIFPLPARLAALSEADIAAFGTSRRRAQTIRLLAQAMTGGEIILAPGVDAATMIERLSALPGIGDWTAQYIALRALCWRDAFPAGDLAVLRALDVRTPAAARAIAQAWRPWRAYAVMNLWGRPAAHS